MTPIHYDRTSDRRTEPTFTAEQVAFLEACHFQPTVENTYVRSDVDDQAHFVIMPCADQSGALFVMETRLAAGMSIVSRKELTGFTTLAKDIIRTTTK